MSSGSKIKDVNYYINWLEKSIAEEHINYYEYSDFKNKQPIGSGSFGNVVRATWKHNDAFFALKFFNDNNKITLKEVVNELKLHRKVDFHENILRFYGITKVEADALHQVKKYSLVLEYADNGTLRTYLNEHFNELQWNDKIGLALQLASAISCLHERGIIHRDLHADNILVHKKIIKLADFGLSKKISEASSNAPKIFGVIPYVDPKSFNNNENQSQNYKLNEKSDIYSIGVLMWQISSGRRPYYSEGVEYDIGLVLAIQEGKREEIINGTPIEYSKLYTECWKYEPSERPDIQEVVSVLKLIFPKRTDMIVDNINEKEIHYNCNSKSSKDSIDINNDLLIDNISSIIGSERSLISQIRPTVSLDIESKNNFEATDSSTDTFESTFNLINHIVIDKLITIITKKHDDGIIFDQIKQLINHQISRSNQATENLINWLSQNQIKPQYIYFLGLLYYYNIGVEEDSIKAFDLLLEASKDNHPLAQVYLAKCYSDGYGTNKNSNLAFNWFKKSVENGSIIGQFYLGYCYEFGIGTLINEKKSVEWYQKAANNGNTTAALYLANCYKLGKGVDKNGIEAFKYYKILADKEISDAQYQLGNCFHHGIGTKIDETQAFCWYEKATTNGNIVANNMLKRYYNKKEKVKLNKLYKILFFKKLSQRGLNCLGTILLKTNYEKGFYYFQKAAENGCKVAQFNLGECFETGIGIKKDERKAFELYKKSAAQGYINATINLGYCYDEGIGTDINKVKAFELYKIAAEKGNINAQHSLGMCYKFGNGVDQDAKKAFEIFKELSDNGDLGAQFQLGCSYNDGIGVDKDEKKAFELFKGLAKNGDLDAQLQLGCCYNNGIGIDKDENKAFEIFKRLAENGDIDAQYNLGMCYKLGNGIGKDEKKAFKLFEELAENGDLDAQLQLGYCYINGIGIDKDEKKAFKLIKELAEKGHLDAQLILSSCHYKGIGTEISKTKAFGLFSIAAEKGDKDEKKAFELFEELD